MSEHYRHLLEKHYVQIFVYMSEGLSNSAIAELSGIPETMVLRLQRERLSQKRLQDLWLAFCKNARSFLLAIGQDQMPWDEEEDAT